jgi:hypothetical protein
MKRIIRTNAVQTSNKSSNLVISLKDLPSNSDLSTIHGGTINPSEAVNFAATPSNTANWSITLQTVLEQTPSIVPCLVLLSSIAFFAIALIAAVSVRIEEVSHLKGKLVADANIKDDIEKQTQKKYLPLALNVELQNQQLINIQNKLNQIKASLTPISLVQSDYEPIDTVELNNLELLSLEENSVDVSQLQTTNILPKYLLTKALKNSYQLQIKEQIKVIARDVPSVKTKITQTRTHLNSEVLPVITAISEPENLKFIRAGDHLQITFDPLNKYEESITGKVVSISNSNSNQKNNQYRSDSTQIKIALEVNKTAGMSTRINSRKNETTTVRVIRKYRISDMLFEPMN